MAGGSLPVKGILIDGVVIEASSLIQSTLSLSQATELGEFFVVPFLFFSSPFLRFSNEPVVDYSSITYDVT